MRRLVYAVTLVALCGSWSSSASAGIYTDDLTRCMVSATSVGDKTDLVVWVFAALAIHPAVKQYANIAPDARERIDTNIANLIERLLTKDCRSQAVAALKYEGEGAMNGSFEVLGKVATQELMTSPAVGTAIGSYASKIDNAKIAALYAEAGLPPPKP
jgi:hypothetical protein